MKKKKMIYGGFSMYSDSPQAQIWRWYRQNIYDNPQEYPNLLKLENKKYEYRKRINKIKKFEERSAQWRNAQWK